MYPQTTGNSTYKQSYSLAPPWQTSQPNSLPLPANPTVMVNQLLHHLASLYGCNPPQQTSTHHSKGATNYHQKPPLHPWGQKPCPSQGHTLLHLSLLSASPMEHNSRWPVLLFLPAMSPPACQHHCLGHSPALAPQSWVPQTMKQTHPIALTLASQPDNYAQGLPITYNETALMKLHVRPQIGTLNSISLHLLLNDCDQ